MNKLSREDERLLESEKELYDLIPRIKGIHGGYVMEHSYESIVRLALAANKIRRACVVIMDSMKHIDQDRKRNDKDLIG